MQKNIIKIIGLIFLTLAFFSCQKMMTSEEYNPDENLYKPDLGKKTQASVNGYVFNNTGEPIANAIVKSGGIEKLTDQFGYFNFDNISLPEAAGFVTVSYNGYITTLKSFKPDSKRAITVRFQLQKDEVAGSFNAANGGTIRLNNGSLVTFDPNSILNKRTNAAYKGTVSVSMIYIDPAETSNSLQNIPGGQIGLDENGYLKFTDSYGILGVELKSPSGDSLQIAPGKQAGISIPIPSVKLNTAKTEASLSSLDFSTGLWKQEGTLTRSGNAYIGKVSHFSFWQSSDNIPLVSFEAQIVDRLLNPIAGGGVAISLRDNPNYFKYELTDNNGYISGYIPANKNLLLKVGGGYAICANQMVNYTNFTTFNQNIDLGTIVGSVEQWSVVLKGTAVDCNNAPITNGYIQTYGQGFYNRVPVTNGIIQFTGLLCAQSEINYIIVNSSTNIQTAAEKKTLSPGTNDLGEIKVCGISALSSISITIDGSKYLEITEPSKYTMAFHNRNTNPDSINLNFTTIVVSDINITNTAFSFQFVGKSGVGNDNYIEEIFLSGTGNGGPDDKRLLAKTPVQLTISEFGNVGEFIIGSFNGSFYDWVGGQLATTPKQVSGTFKAKRVN